MSNADCEMSDAPPMEGISTETEVTPHEDVDLGVSEEKGEEEDDEMEDAVIDEEKLILRTMDGELVCRSRILHQSELINNILTMVRLETDDESDSDELMVLEIPTMTLAQITRAVEWMDEFDIHPFTSLPKYARYLKEDGLTSEVRRSQTEFLKLLIVDDNDQHCFTSFLHFDFDDIIRANSDKNPRSPYYQENLFPVSYDSTKKVHGSTGPDPAEAALTDADYQTLMRNDTYLNDPSTDCPESDPIWGLCQVLGRDINISKFLELPSMRDLLFRRSCELLDDQTTEVMSRLMKTQQTVRSDDIFEVLY
ncbi:MAG: hypothetical protein JKX76_02315 [Colwellia sp.]|nr:hypothetical protein [Colwellia sp.]